MPHKPKKPCGHPGCARLVPAGEYYCADHAPLHKVRETPERGSGYRGYGAAWQKARLAFLAEHPLCAECERRGRVTAATVVDHIVPHKGDRGLFWDRENWQPLCEHCHNEKTAREDRWQVYRF